MNAFKPVDSADPGMVKLELFSSGHERRSQTRYNVNWRAALTFINANGTKETIECKILDVSDGGCSFSSRIHFKSEQRVCIRMRPFLKGEKLEFDVVAEIRHCVFRGDERVCGVKFITHTQKSQSIISGYVQERKRALISTI